MVVRELRSGLNRLRRLPSVNVPIRAALKVLSQGGKAVWDVAKWWPPTGVVSVDIHGIPATLWSEGDDPMVFQLFYKAGPVEREEIQVWKAFAPSSRVIFDVGANTGLYAVVSAAVAPQARVFSFEPHPKNARSLRKNLELNDARNVEVCEIAVSRSVGSTVFAIPADGRISDVSSIETRFTRAYYDIQYQDLTVPMTTLDAFAKERGVFDQVDLVKIDVEYHELAVLEGARELLEKTRPAILAEVFDYDILLGRKPQLRGQISSTNSRDVEDLLRGAGYTLYSVGEAGLLRVDTLRTTDRGGSNFLFVPGKPEEIYVPFADQAAMSALARRVLAR